MGTSKTGRTPVFVKALFTWLVILALAIINGLVRDFFLIQLLEPSTARALSGLLLSTFILAVTCISLPWLGIRTRSRAFLVGAFWLVLTLIFEFAFGIWQGKSWAHMLEAYTFQAGNIWPVVLVMTFGAPYLAGRLRGWL